MNCILQDSDDDWDTEHEVITMSEEQQRWGGARDTGTLDMDKFREDIKQEDASAAAKRGQEDGYNMAGGWGSSCRPGLTRSPLGTAASLACRGTGWTAAPRATTTWRWWRRTAPRWTPPRGSGGSTAWGRSRTRAHWGGTPARKWTYTPALQVGSKFV